VLEREEDEGGLQNKIGTVMRGEIEFDFPGVSRGEFFVRISVLWRTLGRRKTP